PSAAAPTRSSATSSPSSASRCPGASSAPTRRSRRRLDGQRRRSRRCSSSKADCKRIPSSSRLASNAADSPIHPPDLRAGALMDFSFTEEQQEIQGLARQILSDKVTHERLKEIEAEPDWFDRDLWGELAKAGLVGIALPEDVGGGGFGILEACLVLQEVGRTVAPVPYLATVAMAAMPIAEFGTAEQRTRLLAGVADGDTVLTAALTELVNTDPLAPQTTAKPYASQWRLTGTKSLVPAAHLAAGVLVPAATADGIGVFLVDPKGPGV